MADMAISKNKKSDWWRRLLQPVKSSYWLFITRDNGNLEVYSMPDLKLVYLVRNIGYGNNVNMKISFRIYFLLIFILCVGSF